MEKHQKFTITGTNDKLWHLEQLIHFLVENQNKDISLTINPEAISLRELGLYNVLDNFKFASVNIHTDNQLETHDKYKIIVNIDNIFLQEKSNISTTLHSWNGSKIFLNFYGRPTAGRLGIASHLLSEHKNNSLIHFSFGNSLDDFPHYELDKLLEYDINSIEKVGRLITKMPMKQASTNGYSNTRYNFSDQLTQMYQNIFVDIVGETHVLGTTFYPTEKTTRPMWLKKPFIIFGSRDYLCYLRQLGFQTFQTLDDTYWSEDYDGYEGRERYLRILTLIDELAKKSKKELEEMYQMMKPILDHNYNLLVTQSYKKTIKKIIE
jgi:hypothetical protein